MIMTSMTENLKTYPDSKKSYILDKEYINQLKKENNGEIKKIENITFFHNGKLKIKPWPSGTVNQRYSNLGPIY